MIYGKEGSSRTYSLPDFLLSICVDKVQIKILSSTSVSQFGSQINDVVYFHKQLGAAHPKRWWKKLFSAYSQKKEPFLHNFAAILSLFCIFPSFSAQKMLKNKIFTS